MTGTGVDRSSSTRRATNDSGVTACSRPTTISVGAEAVTCVTVVAVRQFKATSVSPSAFTAIGSRSTSCFLLAMILSILVIVVGAAVVAT